MNMLLSRVLRAAFALVALAQLSAADILTVGPAGSGAQFTQIQAAIDAALDDDVILVKPGTYQKITVAKPLRILGDGTGIVQISGSGSGVLVQDIARGEELVLSGVRVQTAGFPPQPVIRVQDCPGRVVLQDVILPIVDPEKIGVQIESCARAVLLDVQIAGAGHYGGFGDTARGAVFAQDSALWIANSEIHGTTEGSSVTTEASHGVEVENSSLRVWRSRILGGSNPPTMKGSAGDGGTGIRAVSSRVELLGGPTSEVTGGDGSYASVGMQDWPGGPGVDLLQDSSARIQEDIPIQGGFDGLGIAQAPDIQVDGSSSYSLVSEVFPTLVSSDLHAQLGSSFDLTLAGNPGASQILFFSLRLGPTDDFRGVGGRGVLDRLSLSRAARVLIPPSGVHTATFLVPNTSALLGTTLFFRNLEKSASGSALGNPALVTISG